jgi:hypothetical protein
MVNNSDGLAGLLDKMVDYLLQYEEIPFLDLVQEIWRRGYDISTAPVPLDGLAIRCALKACILERMAEIWCTPPKNTPTEPPLWCHSVPPLKEHFSVVAPEFASFWVGEEGSNIFAKRNIFAPKEFMFFL